jgi:hypothetical protein
MANGFEFLLLSLAEPAKFAEMENIPFRIVGLKSRIWQKCYIFMHFPMFPSPEYTKYRASAPRKNRLDKGMGLIHNKVKMVNKGGHHV